MDYAHVKDEGLRRYLEDDDPQVDHNTTANILDYTWQHILEDFKNPILDYAVVEQRESLFEDAEEAFGWRSLKDVHKYLRKVWGV